MPVGVQEGLEVWVALAEDAWAAAGMAAGAEQVPATAKMAEGGGAVEAEGEEEAVQAHRAVDWVGAVVCVSDCLTTAFAWSVVHL